jgi:TPR repeat protein
MDRVEVGTRWSIGLTAIAALVPAVSLAQQHPGLSAVPTGRTVALPPAKEWSIDLAGPEMQQLALATTEAESVYFDAALRGEAWAQTRLGRIYAAATNDPERQRRGVELLRLAAAQNDAEALLELSSLATFGSGLERSDMDAFEYCLRAAKSGSPQAQYRLAIMYAGGRGTTQDRDAAISWFRKAALQGYAPAKYDLALALLESRKEGEDNSEAIGWLEDAAKDGHREATFFLAGATAHGDYGLTKDEKKAEEMALPRAEAGDAEFQFALATLYMRGESFANRRADGEKWLRKAAAAGHSRAQAMLVK